MATLSTNKLAVVTGASSGIGFELAKQAVKNGYDVIVCADGADITAAATEIAGDSGARVEAVQADLATPEGCQQLVQAVRDSGREVDALLLNAGIGVGGAFIETSLDEEIKMMALNCGHTIVVGKALIPRMVQRGEGKVLVTASVVSTSPSPYQTVYGATKAFVMSFAEGIREELKDTGVTVTALQPAATDTNFFERADMMDTKVGQGKKDDPALVAERGFEAMEKGLDSILGGGMKGRVQGLMNEVLPETMKAHQVAKTTKPGSGSH